MLLNTFFDTIDKELHLALEWSISNSLFYHFLVDKMNRL